MPTADEPVSLVCGDALEVLPTLDVLAIAAVVTDPPYGVGFNYSSHDDGRAAYLRMVPRWYKALSRFPMAITPGIDNVGHWPQARWVLAWLKSNSMGPNRLSGPGAVSRNLWEPVLWYGKYPPNPPSRDIIHAPLLAHDKVDHPCPKPLALARALVEMASTPGGIVVDPFMGSGTTGVACVHSGRRFIGIEIDPTYFATAEKRINAALGVGGLFPPKSPAVADLFASETPR